MALLTSQSLFDQYDWRERLALAKIERQNLAGVQELMEELLARGSTEEQTRERLEVALRARGWTEIPLQVTFSEELGRMAMALVPTRGKAEYLIVRIPPGG